MNDENAVNLTSEYLKSDTGRVLKALVSRGSAGATVDELVAILGMSRAIVASRLGRLIKLNRDQDDAAWAGVPPVRKTSDKRNHKAVLVAVITREDMVPNG